MISTVKSRGRLKHQIFKAVSGVERDIGGISISRLIFSAHKRRPLYSGCELAAVASEAPEANWHHGLRTLWLKGSRTDSPPHSPGLFLLATTETPVMAAGWSNHQQAVGPEWRKTCAVPSSSWQQVVWWPKHGRPTAEEDLKKEKFNSCIPSIWHGSQHCSNTTTAHERLFQKLDYYLVFMFLLNLRTDNKLCESPKERYAQISFYPVLAYNHRWRR